MDFGELIRKHVGEDGNIAASEIDKLVSAVSTAVGRDFVDKARYRAKLDEIETLKTEKQTAEDNATAAAGWKKKHDDLKQSFDDYKLDIANKETLAAKKAAHRKLLAEKKINDADIDLIMAATDYDGMKLDDKGDLADVESIKSDIDTKYARYIPKVESHGDNPATPPNNPNGGDNAAEIRALTAKWHAAKYGETKTN